MKTKLLILTVTGLLTTAGWTAEKAPAKKTPPAPPPGPPPTLANVAYGTHPKQVLDFWKANSDKPTPLVFHIHGGGWTAGDKARVGNVKEFLAAEQPVWRPRVRVHRQQGKEDLAVRRVSGRPRQDSVVDRRVFAIRARHR